MRDEIRLGSHMPSSANQTLLRTEKLRRRRAVRSVTPVTTV